MFHSSDIRSIIYFFISRDLVVYRWRITILINALHWNLPSNSFNYYYFSCFFFPLIINLISNGLIVQAVCYLNNYKGDFSGGLFRFQDGEPPTIEPSLGVSTK